VTAFASIRSCQELNDAQLSAVVESRDDVRALLEHVATIARPGEGGPRVLLLFAKMATSACDWLDGALQIVLRADGQGTSIESFAVIGAGLRERVVPRVVMSVPIGEFLDVVGRFPHLIAPLAVTDVSGSHVALAAKEAEHQETPSEPPDEDEEADSSPPPRASAEPSVARRLPPPPRVPLPVVLPEAASKSVPPAPQPSAARPPANPPAKRTQVAVAVARIAKPQAKPHPIEDEPRAAAARRHPAAEPSLRPDAPSKPDAPAPTKPGDGVDEGWE
jgi:hypothetical protein